MEHKHIWKLFIEEGCTDNKAYNVCKCGEILDMGEIDYGKRNS
jgi:hypothetical protein